MTEWYERRVERGEGNLIGVLSEMLEFRSLERLISTGIVRVLRHSNHYGDLPEIADLIARDREATTG